MYPRLRRLLVPYRYLKWATQHFGLRFALSSALLALGSGLVELPIQGDRRVRIRPGTADMSIFKEIWIDKSYDVIARPPAFIIDAGAHIGLASAFFATRFPDAHIVAIEPDQQNFELMCRNLAQFRHVRTIKGGLWGTKTLLRITNPGVYSWAYRLAAGGDIEGMTVDDILCMTGQSTIDVLKMDIEGSEFEVLATSASWMGRVRTILIELHDRFRPGCTEALERAIEGHDFHRSTSGEYAVLVRNTV